MSDPDLTLLMQLCRQTLDEVKGMRVELREVSKIALLNVDMTRRAERRVAEVERRIDELKDDVETIIKAEIGGRLAHVETRLEHYLDREIEERLRAGEGGLSSPPR